MCDPKDVICVICNLSQQECFTEALEENELNMLKAVIPKNVEQKESVKSQHICIDCAKDLKSLFDFKSQWLENEKLLLSHLQNKKPGEKIGLIDVLQTTVFGGSIANDCVEEICRLCMRGTTLEMSSNLYKVKAMLTQCIPDINPTLTTKTVFCHICVGALEKYTEFLNTYNTKNKDDTVSVSSTEDECSDDSFTEENEMDCDESNISAKSNGETSQHAEVLEDNVTEDSPNNTNKNSDNLCDCIVCKIKNKGFSQFSFKEQIAIHKKGRPEPALKKLVKRYSNITRHFNTQLYRNTTWLTGCDSLSRVFCWPCLLFSDVSNAQHSGWIKTGYVNLQNIYEGIKKHSQSFCHMRAATKDKFFKRMYSNPVETVTLKENFGSHNKIVERNRIVLKTLVNIICYLVKSENSLKNADSFATSFELLSKHDVSIDGNWFKTYNSLNLIHNSINKAMVCVVSNHIREEIKNVQFVSLILVNSAKSETQLSILVRYVKGKEIHEHTLGFLEVTTEKTTEELFQTISEILYDIDAKHKLISLSVIGAAIIKTDRLKKLQTKLAQVFHNCKFIYFWEYKLDVLLAQCLMYTIPQCKVFFSVIKGIGELFLNSKKTAEVFYKAIGKCPATKEWTFRGTLLKTVCGYRKCLIGFFEFILNSPEIWDLETINLSKGYLGILTSDRDFNFLLHNLQEIFSQVTELQEELHDRACNITYCYSKIQKFNRFLKDCVIDFEPVWGGLDPISEPAAKRQRTEQIDSFYKNLFLQICDTLTEEMKLRFQNFMQLDYLKLLNFDNFEKTPIPTNFFAHLKDNYEHLFEIGGLRSELSVIFSSPEIRHKNNALQLLAFLKDEEFDKIYVETVKLCQFLLTIPIEKFGNSAFDRVQNRCKSSMSGEILTDFSTLCVEKELLSELSERPMFFEEVMLEFAKNDNGIEVSFK